MLRIALRRSPRLGVVLAAVHGAAAASATWLLPPLAAGCALLALALGLLQAWPQHVLRTSADAIVALELQDGLRLIRRDGSVVPAALASRFLSPAAVVLTATPQGARRRVALVIPADAVGADEHRRLRTWLAWQPASAPGHAEPNA